MERPDMLGGRLKYLGIAAGLAAAAASYLVLPNPYSFAAAPLLVFSSFFVFVMLPILRRKLTFTSVDFDMVYLIGHMLSVSTGKPPRSALFKSVGEEYPYPKYSRLFYKIYLLGTEWGYSFAEACRLIARTVRNKLLRDFLIRLGSVLAVGEDVEVFLTTEYNTFVNEYETHYSRMVDAARVFLGVYTAMMGSTIFVLANFLMLAFFFGGSGRIVVMSFLGVSIAAVALFMLLYILIPSEPFSHNMPIKPRELRLVQITSLMAVAIAVFMGALYMARGATYERLAVVFILAGGLLLAPGLTAKLVERRVKELDEFFPIFIRSYGMHLSTIPSMPRALEPLLSSELGRLNVFLRNLYARLVNGIDPRVAWRFFAGETGSELIRRAVRVFMDTVEYGGDVAKAGSVISDHQNMLIRLRRLRTQVAKTFETTTYIMHAATIMITVFISRLIQVFSEILANLQAQVPPEVSGVFFMGMIEPRLLVMASLMFIVVITVTNALAITRALPGLKHSFWFYLAILSMLSGLSVILGSKLLDLVISAGIGSLENLAQTLSV